MMGGNLSWKIYGSENYTWTFHICEKKIECSYIWDFKQISAEQKRYLFPKKNARYFRKSIKQSNNFPVVLQHSELLSIMKCLDWCGGLRDGMKSFPLLLTEHGSKTERGIEEA